jgi:protein SCO1/2
MADSTTDVRRSDPRGIAAVLALLLVAALSTGCEDDTSRSARGAQNTLSLDVDTTLTDTSYALRNQDSAAVTVPDDLLGTPVLLGTVYTNCPNVCPRITANMKSVRDRLEDTTTVQFVSVTFDPHRDTPSRLAAYRDRFDLTDTSWHFLTGDRATIARLMGRLDVRYTIKGTDRAFPEADTARSYTYAHSNQITLIDAEGRVRAAYAGSQTPPDHIISDLQTLRR